MKKRVFATVTVSMAAAAMITGSAMAADYKVGIIQFVDDASLNQIEANIEAELRNPKRAKTIIFLKEMYTMDRRIPRH